MGQEADRYLWSERGGKNNALLQRIKLAYGDSHEALYLPLDNIWFQERCMLSGNG
ncbi:MAG: hypothetical protein ACLR6J_20005 [Parabacteroides merdae]